MLLPLRKKTTAGVDFFSPDSNIWSHGGGFDLPEGDYIWPGLEVLMFSGFDGKQTQRLGVMITVIPKDDPEAAIITASGETHEGRVFYSFGTKAHESWVPNADGTGIEPIPGGNGKLTDKSNWAVLAKSLQDSGLPKGVAANDVSALIGTWVHMQSIPEPEERKTFQSQTGDTTQEKRYTRNISIVTEIFDDGKPWEGTGGIPEAGAKQVAKKGVRVPPKALEKVEPEAEAELDEDTLTAAQGAMATVLEKSPKSGTPKAAFKLNVGKAIKKDYGDDVFQIVMDQILENEENLSAILDQLDFKVAGAMIKPK